MVKNKHMACIFSLLFCIFIASEADARKVEKLGTDWYSFDFQCQVDELDKYGDYISVCEKKVYLINASHHKMLCRTNICDINGNNVPFASIPLKKWVYIRGLVFPNETKAALAIYILPHRIGEKDLVKYPALNTLQTWERILNQSDR